MKVQADRAAKDAEAWLTTVSGWPIAPRKTEDIGGDKWDATVLNAQKAIGRFGTPALKEYLQASAAAAITPK